MARGPIQFRYSYDSSSGSYLSSSNSYLSSSRSHESFSNPTAGSTKDNPNIHLQQSDQGTRILRRHTTEALRIRCSLDKGGGADRNFFFPWTIVLFGTNGNDNGTEEPKPTSPVRVHNFIHPPPE